MEAEYASEFSLRLDESQPNEESPVEESVGFSLRLEDSNILSSTDEVIEQISEKTTGDENKWLQDSVLAEPPEDSSPEEVELVAVKKKKEKTASRGGTQHAGTCAGRGCGHRITRNDNSGPPCTEEAEATEKARLGRRRGIETRNWRMWRGQATQRGRHRRGRKARERGHHDQQACKKAENGAQKAIQPRPTLSVRQS